MSSAISKAVWGSEKKFFDAFAQNEESKFADMVEDDPLSAAVKQFAEKMENHTLRLESTKFLEKLKAQVGIVEYSNAKNNFPQSASALGKRIPRIQPALAAVGIDIAQTKSNGQRHIMLTRNY